MNIGIIIQCRMSSSRLPGKTMRLVKGRPMLQYLLESLEHCRRGKVVAATSDEKSDEPIVDFCRSFGVPCYKGPLEDVASRFAGAARHFGFDCFVRISGDSPLLDYRLVDKGLELFSGGGYHLVTNILPRTFPKGQSVEVIDAACFLDSIGKFSGRDEAEHVTPYFYSRQEDFLIHNFESGGDYSSIRLSVDTEEDMMRFQDMVSRMDKNHWEYSYLDLIERLG